MALTPRLSTGRTSDFLSGPTGIQSVTSQRILGRASGGTGASEELTLSQTLDLVGGATHGDILFRGASGWTRLPAGTAGQFLQTQGPGANPVWANAGGGGGTVGLNDGASGAPSLFFNNQPALGMYRLGADTIVWTRALNEDRMRWFFPPTAGTNTNPNLLALAAVTEIWFDSSSNLPAGPLTGSNARIKASEPDTVGFLNGGGASDYRPMSLKFYRRRDQLTDAFFKIGFATASTTNANTLFQVVQAGATSADMQFVIPGTTTSRYLFTIGSTSVLILRSDGGHELNGAGSPNQAGVCVQNSGGPPFGRVALATLASLNGVLNICRYGVQFSESAIRSGCQFVRRSGLPPGTADLPETGEWALWGTSTDLLNSIFVNVGGTIASVGGWRRIFQGADFVTTSTTLLPTNLQVTLVAGQTYFVRALLHVDTGAAATAGFQLEVAGTAAGALRLAAMHTGNNGVSNPLFRFTAIPQSFLFGNGLGDSTVHAVLVVGTFTVTTGGTFLFQFSSGDGGSVTLLGQSFLEISR